ncbi:MAG: DUF1302 family protein, partial [Pseudomonadota bacterium]
MFPRTEFESLVRQTGAERRARRLSPWDRFVGMRFCQPGRAHRLREIKHGLKSCEGKGEHMRMARKWTGLWAAAAALLCAEGAQARDFNFDLFGQDINAILNNSFTAGAQWRLHDRADYLVGKSNLDPDVCTGVYQLCQGVIRDQDWPAAHLRDAPGQASMNFDNGNLNY